MWGENVEHSLIDFVPYFYKSFCKSGGCCMGIMICVYMCVIFVYILYHLRLYGGYPVSFPHSTKSRTKVLLQTDALSEGISPVVTGNGLTLTL